MPKTAICAILVRYHHRGEAAAVYYVYLLRCADGSLYGGITTDLARRFAEHAGQTGRGAKYTAAHRPLRFEAAWRAPDRAAASRLEYRLKALPKAEKESLLRGETPPALDLSGYTQVPVAEIGEDVPNPIPERKLSMDFQRMLQYCAALEQHNERPWFHENHGWYDDARGDYLALLEVVRFAIAESAPALADDILYGPAKSWVYRVARDMRYSHNLPPYNPAFRAYISADRKSWLPIGYFLRVAPGASCFGTGLWCEDTATTNLVRDYLAEHCDEFERLRKKSGLAITGDTLKTMPRGYSESHPAAKWLKHKYWDVIVNFPDSELTDFETFDKEIRVLVKKMEPLRQFFLTAARSSRTEKKSYQDFYRV